jgi:hypothetical protein
LISDKSKQDIEKSKKRKALKLYLISLVQKSLFRTAIGARTTEPEEFCMKGFDRKESMREYQIINKKPKKNKSSSIIAS